jgi:kinesin family protein 11
MSHQTRSAENVQVVVRCRPISQQEIQSNQQIVCKTDEASRTVEVKTPLPTGGGGDNKKNSAPANRVYTFDAVYGPSSSQRDIYVVCEILSY